MKHTVIINDNTQAGKNLVGLLKTLPTKTVSFIEDDERIDDCIPAELVFAELKKKVIREYKKSKK